MIIRYSKYLNKGKIKQHYLESTIEIMALLKKHFSENINKEAGSNFEFASLLK
jgi:hypothetical protein